MNKKPVYYKINKKQFARLKIAAYKFTKSFFVPTIDTSKFLRVKITER